MEKTHMETEEPDCLSMAEIRAGKRRNHNKLQEARRSGQVSEMFPRVTYYE